MNKQFTKAIVGVLFLVATNAKAVFLPNWERPIYGATMTEFDTQGHEVNEDIQKRLVMGRRDGNAESTSFTLEETHRVYCVTTHCPEEKKVTTFKIVGKTTDACGSITYDATASDGSVFVPMALFVTDHTTRTCKDYNKYEWEVKMYDGTRRPPRILSGNPDPIYTVQRGGEVEEAP